MVKQIMNLHEIHLILDKSLYHKTYRELLNENERLELHIPKHLLSIIRG